MKKLIMMAATLIMCFAFSLSVMAAPSPEDEYYNTSTEQEKVDEKTQIDDDEFDKDENQLRRKQQRHQHHQHQQHLHHQRLVIRSASYISICITRCSSISCICSKTRQRTVLIKNKVDSSSLDGLEEFFCIWDF